MTSKYWNVRSEDLARIRNNQRRSRAKRLEYIRDLEEKAKKYDDLIESTSTPSLPTVERLQSENAWMRGLLATLDINSNSLDAPEPHMVPAQWNSSSLPPDMGLNFDIPLLSNDANISTNLDTPTVGQTELNPQLNQYQGCCKGAESSATSNSNTTLCSLACQWGNNPLEGCRVDNQVLLEVLTEIS
ncbi:Pc13g08530 [Penicillium rubens Wisconsin 54-1255]|uniref:Pc13g08530 protein n=1 Tax=Penicillium rubens (strain ATCC 28089 / DSM 1075 / NRRL 1951 / Wisconsin 54-1255) TaxID=500485 RepID=B6H4E0_PENRW|nr:Pc13g08530 [Penicillium rubens Wisconsin 54-1255]